MDGKIADFVRVTNADADVAKAYLDRAGGDLERAVASFLEGGTEGSGPDPGEGSVGGPLGGQGVGGPPRGPLPPTMNSGPPVAKAASSSAKRRSGIVSFSDLNSANSEEGQDYFAGGYNSGINVHDPNAENDRGEGSSQGPGPARGNDLVNTLLSKAQRQPPAPDGPSEQPAMPPRFGGAGQRLGDGTGPEPAQTTQERKSAPQPRNMEYRLTLWRDGFTVEDGPLRNYQDPANQAFLEEILRGFIPEELVANQPVREVAIKLENRKDEDYTPPKVKPQPFGGAGMRLGSEAATAQPSSEPAPAPAASTASTGPSDDVAVDTTQPLLSIQVRMADGTKLIARLNHTHTIQDLRSYIEARHNLGGRTYELSTTFPRTVLSDNTQTVKDAKLDGAVVVVTLR